MANEQEEAVSEELGIDATEGEGDPIARLEAKIDALLNSHEERIARLEAGAGGFAAAEHEHEYAGREHEHARETSNEHDAGSHQETREEGRETAPRSSHPYYRPIRELFSK